MTLGDIFSQMGLPPRQLTDRYSEYPAQTHEHHVYYPYESAAPSHGHGGTSKHHYSGGGSHKGNAAMSALTLLAFLFFLHILQQCLRDHMASMTSPQVMIMTSSRETEDNIEKNIEKKMDKSGVKEDYSESNVKYDNTISESTESMAINRNEDKYLTKLSISEYIPKTSAEKYKQILEVYSNQNENIRNYKSKQGGSIDRVLK